MPESKLTRFVALPELKILHMTTGARGLLVLEAENVVTSASNARKSLQNRCQESCQECAPRKNIAEVYFGHVRTFLISKKYAKPTDVHPL